MKITKFSKTKQQKLCVKNGIISHNCKSLSGLMEAAGLAHLLLQPVCCNLSCFGWTMRKICLTQTCRWEREGLTDLVKAKAYMLFILHIRPPCPQIPRGTSP